VEGQVKWSPEAHPLAFIIIPPAFVNLKFAHFLPHLRLLQQLRHRINGQLWGCRINLLICWILNLSTNKKYIFIYIYLYLSVGRTTISISTLKTFFTKILFNIQKILFYPNLMFNKIFFVENPLFLSLFTIYRNNLNFTDIFLIVFHTKYILTYQSKVLKKQFTHFTHK